jgi:hypothetical protein
MQTGERTPRPRTLVKAIHAVQAPDGPCCPARTAQETADCNLPRSSDLTPRPSEAFNPRTERFQIACGTPHSLSNLFRSPVAAPSLLPSSISTASVSNSLANPSTQSSCYFQRARAVFVEPDRLAAVPPGRPRIPRMGLSFAYSKFAFHPPLTRTGAFKISTKTRWF